MNMPIFITGNQAKADYLARWLGHPVEHQKCEVDELQSLDLREVAAHKARAAYERIGKCVLVEDVSLTFAAWGRLPGTLIKWHLEELGVEKLAQKMHDEIDRRATAAIAYGLYDGHEMHIFEGAVQGTVPLAPRNSEQNGWKGSKSWNSIFIPDGYEKTYAQMTDEELQGCSHRYQAIIKLRDFLDKQA